MRTYLLVMDSLEYHFCVLGGFHLFLMFDIQIKQYIQIFSIYPLGHNNSPMDMISCENKKWKGISWTSVFAHFTPIEILRMRSTEQYNMMWIIHQCIILRQALWVWALHKNNWPLKKWIIHMYLTSTKELPWTLRRFFFSKYHTLTCY